MPAMILHAFSGDGAGCWSNRQPNELIFTAQRDDGVTFSAIVPGAMLVQLLEPAARTLPVTSVRRDGEVFHAQLARYDDEAPVHSGVYLASIFAVVFVAGKEYDGAALASVRVDEDLPQIARPGGGPEDPRRAAKATKRKG